MGFNNNNNNSNYNNNGFRGGFNNNNGEQQGPRKQFPINKLYGSDGVLAVGIYKNPEKGTIYCSMNITKGVQDPSTGTLITQNRNPAELPSILLHQTNLMAILDAVDSIAPDKIDMTVDTNRGTKISFKGSPSGVKVIIENQKTGTGEVNLVVTPTGVKDSFAAFEVLKKNLEVALVKLLTNKIDQFPEEFGSSTNEASSDDTPF